MSTRKSKRLIRNAGLTAISLSLISMLACLAWAKTPAKLEVSTLDAAGNVIDTTPLVPLSGTPAAVRVGVVYDDGTAEYTYTQAKDFPGMIPPIVVVPPPPPDTQPTTQPTPDPDAGIIVEAGADLTKLIRDGVVLRLKPGRYKGPGKISAKSGGIEPFNPPTIARARLDVTNPKSPTLIADPNGVYLSDVSTDVILDGSGMPTVLSFGGGFEVAGVHITGGGTATQDNKYAGVQVADGAALTGCIVDKVLGLGISVIGDGASVEWCIAQDNGFAGIGGSSSKNVKVRHDIIRRNGFQGGNPKNANVGGGKFTRLGNGLNEYGWNQSYGNMGVGMWTDYINLDQWCHHNLIHDNVALIVGGSVKIGSAGIFHEISGVKVPSVGSTTIIARGTLTTPDYPGRTFAFIDENNLVWNNANEGIQYWATQNALIRNNRCWGNKNNMMLRGNREAPFEVKDLIIENNDFDAQGITNQGAGSNYVARGNK